MGRYVWQILLLSLVLTVPCLCQDDMLSLVVDINKDSISVGLGDPDLCKGFRCPTGSKCVIQKSPALLMIPVPHCVADKPSPVPVSNEVCKKIIVGTYILNCLTKSQWMDIGKKQCERVLQDQPAKLANSRMWHVCPSFGVSQERKYLSASFNCCREGAGTMEILDATAATSTTRAVAATLSSEEVHEPSTMLPPVPVQHSKGVSLVEEVAEQAAKAVEQAAEVAELDPTIGTTVHTINMFYLLLLVLGLALMFSCLLLSLLISLSKMRKRRMRQEIPEKVATTSVVNPVATTEYDHASIIHHSDDKSGLVDNMQITY